MTPLLVIAVVLLLVSGPVALAVSLGNRSELRRLREENAHLRGGVSTTPPRSAASSRSAVRMPTEHERDVERMIGGEWLTWIGILAIFFGAAFFLAVDLGDHALSGRGQVASGIAVGVAFALAGLRLSPTGARRVLARGLLGGGVALLFLSAYGTYGFHRLVSAPTVYVFLFAVATVGAGLALRRNAASVATLTAVGALLTPLFLRSDGDPSRFLFPYSLVVLAGATHVGMRRQWPNLTLAAVAGTTLLFGTWLFGDWPRVAMGDAVGRTTARWIAMVSGTLAWVLIVSTPIVAGARHRVWSTTRDVIVVSSGLLLAGFVYGMLAPGLEASRGAALAGLALANVAASVLARESTRGHATFLYTAVSLLVAAAPVQFDGSWVSIAWVSLAVVLIAAGLRSDRSATRWLGYAVAIIVLARIAVFDAIVALRAAAERTVGGNAEFATALLGGAALVATSVALARARRAGIERHAGTALLVATCAALWLRGTAEVMLPGEARRLSGTLGEEGARSLFLAVSWFWALYAAALVGVGFWSRVRPLRLLGVAIIAVLVVKVFVLDMQVLERGERVASFVGVGVLLLVVSAIYQRDRRSSARRT